MDTINTIRAFITDNFLFNDDSGLTPDRSFLEYGIIDSTGVMELATFLEKTFQFSIEDHEFIAENMDSLARIEKFVKRKIETRQKNDPLTSKKFCLAESSNHGAFVSNMNLAN